MADIWVQGRRYVTPPGSVRVIDHDSEFQMIDALDGSLRAYIPRPQSNQGIKAKVSARLELEFSEESYADPFLFDKLEILRTTNTAFNLDISWHQSFGWYRATRIDATHYIVGVRSIFPPNQGTTWSLQVKVGAVLVATGFTVDSTTGSITFDNEVPATTDVFIKFDWIPTCIVESMNLIANEGVYGANRNYYEGAVILKQLFYSTVVDPRIGYDPAYSRIEPSNATVLSGGPIPTPASLVGVFERSPDAQYRDISIRDVSQYSNFVNVEIPFAWLNEHEVISGFRTIDCAGWFWPDTVSTFTWSQDLRYTFSATFKNNPSKGTLQSTKLGPAGGQDLSEFVVNEQEGTRAFGTRYASNWPDLFYGFDYADFQEGILLTISFVNPNNSTSGNTTKRPFRLALTGVAELRRRNKPGGCQEVVESVSSDGEVSNYVPNAEFFYDSHLIVSNNWNTQSSAACGGNTLLANLLWQRYLAVIYQGPGSPPSYVKFSKFDLAANVVHTGSFPSQNPQSDVQMIAPEWLTVTPGAPSTTSASKTAGITSSPQKIGFNGNLNIPLNFNVVGTHLRQVSNSSALITVSSDIKITADVGINKTKLRVYYGVPVPTRPIALQIDPASAGTGISIVNDAGEDDIPDYTVCSSSLISRIAIPGATPAVIKTSAPSLFSSLGSYWVCGVKITFQMKASKAMTVNVDWSNDGTFAASPGVNGDALAVTTDWKEFTVGGIDSLLDLDPITKSGVFNIAEMDDSILRIQTGSLDISDTVQIRGIRAIYFVVPKGRIDQ